MYHVIAILKMSKGKMMRLYFLRDLDQYLRTNNITYSKFNQLDLNTIRACNTNTQAIEEYFRQYPMVDNYNRNNKIIHTFSTNI